ncbi:GerAB/ArcD/ProY family transporter [Paenibacillus harenae]|uniref:GerAB/ArcD/ProY family transporter n=1 Tax=Paenibacillus harenae TaxID=306543 RepID=UPI000421D0D0|nr:GerAB/ArcD/ProY family transporter [Paenibacillus harenae]
MSKPTAISPTQLFAMIILFEFGTALVLPIGMAPGPNVWLSILIAMPGGILLYLLLAYFAKQYPSLNLSGYIQKIVGVYIGWPISLLFILIFIYISSRNLREAGDLLIASSYDQTPLAVVHAAMIIPVIYVVYKGVNVLFRVGEIYLIIMLALGALSFIATLMSGAIDLKNLLPVMGEGWIPTLKNAYPNIFLFPFAELFCFATIMPHFKQKQIAGRTGMIAIITSSVLLSLTHALEVTVVGADVYTRATFPLFTVISTVKAAEFLQRLDAIVILALIIGVFFKMTMYAYAAAAIAADIFRFAEQRSLAYPIGAVILLVSIMSAWSYPEHSTEGSRHLLSLHPFFMVILPVLLLIIHLIRKRFSHNRPA